MRICSTHRLFQWLHWCCLVEHLSKLYSLKLRHIWGLEQLLSLYNRNVLVRYRKLYITGKYATYILLLVMILLVCVDSLGLSPQFFIRISSWVNQY